jgi:hypothetical protein
MPQAIQIEAQAKQKSLTLLHRQRATGSSCRELALHRTEQTLDQSTAAIEASWEFSAHLGAHAMDVPGFLTAAPERVDSVSCW